jgi:hypothetical protein
VSSGRHAIYIFVLSVFWALFHYHDYCMRDDLGFGEIILLFMLQALVSRGGCCEKSHPVKKLSSP